MDNKNEIDQYDLDEIARLVASGNTSGILSNDEDYTISWSIEIDKFKN